MTKQVHIRVNENQYSIIEKISISEKRSINQIAELLIDYGMYKLGLIDEMDINPVLIEQVSHRASVPQNISNSTAN